VQDYVGIKPTKFETITRFLGLFLLAPLLFLATIPVAIHISQKPDFGFAVHQLEVRSLLPLGPADRAGLQTRDRIVNVDGQAISSMYTWFAATAGNYDRAPLLLTIDREGTKHTFEITPLPPRHMVMIRDYSMWVAGLAFLLIGWWVFYLREDIVARNFFALCIMFAFLLLDIPELPVVSYMKAKEYLRALIQLMLPAYFLRFFLQFPSPKFQAGGSLRRWRNLLWPGWIIFVLSVSLELFFPDELIQSLSPSLEYLGLVYSLVFFLAGLVVFTKRILRKDRPIQRSRMLVILAGLVVGLLPFLAAMMIATLNPESSVAQWQYLAFSLLLVPASFGLSIMRYGALDKSFILRISLIYGFLTLSVLLVYFLIVVGLGQLLADLFSISTYPVLLIVVAACSLTVLPLRRLIQGWIDVTFYPGRRVNQNAFNSLAKDLTALIDADEVMQNLLTGLDRLLSPKNLALYINPDSENPDFAPLALRGNPDAGNRLPNLSRESSLAILLDRLRRPIFSEELEDILFTGDTDPHSLGILTRLKTNLLVPLISGNRLLGFLAFGAKKSGALFTQEDLNHFNNLAVQVGSLLESRLLYRDSLKQKITETELELARKIQNGLLPGEPLENDCFIIAGYQESCRKVGGDYFDYFIRKDGTLAFALADVAGKGIPAALHMTSLRVAFRQEAEAENLPHLVVKRLNNTVFNLASSGHFICFFYGIWNSETGILNYCNAGCEPPILMNPRKNFHQYLRMGGPVLGVTDEHDYRQGSVALIPQDRLFLFTDGLTDQQNQAGEFFDMPRLLALLENHPEATPSHLLETIFSTINAFGGPERSDDKTAISLEIKKLQ
jgi:serine phosphatase RsbU (regulator of sigma subunit)